MKTAEMPKKLSKGFKDTTWKEESLESIGMLVLTRKEDLLQEKAVEVTEGLHQLPEGIPELLLQGDSRGLLLREGLILRKNHLLERLLLAGSLFLQQRN